MYLNVFIDIYISEEAFLLHLFLGAPKNIF